MFIQHPCNLIEVCYDFCQRILSLFFIIIVIIVIIIRRGPPGMMMGFFCCYFLFFSLHPPPTAPPQPRICFSFVWMEWNLYWFVCVFFIFFLVSVQ